METTNHKNTATLIHLSTLTQYFIPFGNFIFPIIIWSATKKNSEFVDNHGRNAINFQLSIFLYCLALGIIAIPVLLFTIFKNIPFKAIIDGNDDFIAHFSMANITGMTIIALIAVLIFICLKTAEFFLVIYASVKAANGEDFKYPLAISFIRTPKKFSGITGPTIETEPQP